jgi:hypothetical protein
MNPISCSSKLIAVSIAILSAYACVCAEEPKHPSVAVEITRDSKFSVDRQLPPLVQLSKSGDLVSSEGAPVTYPFFANLAKDEKALRSADGRAVVVVDVIDDDMTVMQLNSFIERVETALPAKSLIKLIIRFNVREKR